MNRSVILLATLHEFQGLAKYPDSIEGSDYASGIESCIRSGRVDFVFEEAAELGPSIAEQHSNLFLEQGHYLDIDSGRGKSNPLGGSKPICGFTSISVGPSKTREDEWFQRVNVQQFKRGLVICGVAHSLSFAFRLQDNGFEVELCQHLPYERLCKREHVE
jgi:hypothetical protein